MRFFMLEDVGRVSSGYIHTYIILSRWPHQPLVDCFHEGRELKQINLICKIEIIRITRYTLRKIY